MGRNFDDYPGFQPFRSWANTYAQDCIKVNFQNVVAWSIGLRANTTKNHILKSKKVTDNKNGSELEMFDFYIWTIQRGEHCWCRIFAPACAQICPVTF